MTNLLRIECPALAEGWRNFAESWSNWWNNYIGDHIGFGLYLLLFCVAIVVLIVAYKAIFRNKSDNLFKWLSRYLLGTAFVVWFLGVVLYIVGFYDTTLNGLAIVPRAVISSFKMFVVAHDLARVHPTMMHDALYMTAFSLIHFFAAFISLLFVFKLVGYKVKSWWKIFKYNHFNRVQRPIHLFWGINEASLLLAEDIRNNQAVADDTIIFIDIDEERDEHSKSVTLSRVTNSITINDREMERLEGLGGIVLVDHCYNGPASVSPDSVDSVYSALRLDSIGSIVEKSYVVRHYFLSNDEQQNIASALNVLGDVEGRQADSGKRVEIYIHARRSACNEVFDHYSQYMNLDEETQRLVLKVVDSAYLSVATLKTEDKHLPVECVEFDPKTSLVKTPFTAMVVGFGGTGQEAFKFLYEFATFIGSDKKRVPFRCFAVDSKMDSIGGVMRRKIPAIKEDKLTFVNATVDSEAFWECVAENINSLNYIIITINDDAEGLSLAVNLFKYAVKCRRDNLPTLKIRLRCYNRSKEQKMRKVIDMLNNSKQGGKTPINVDLDIFGEEKKLYQYELIVDDNVLKKAKRYHWVYEGSDPKISEDDKWNESFGSKKIEGKLSSMSRYHAIYDVNRQISQNISNVLHQSTKLTLMGLKDATAAELERYIEIAAGRDKGTPNYHCSAKEMELLWNMAILEHERWEASHEMMGFTYAEQDDSARKHNKCMKPWEELTDKYKSYDCNVVETTIKLAREELDK